MYFSVQNAVQDQLKFLFETIKLTVPFFLWNKTTELKSIFWKQICLRVFLRQTQQIPGVVAALLPEI